MTTFRIWLPKEETRTIQADSVTFKRVPEVGLTVKFKTVGKKTEVFEGVSALTEVSKKIKEV